MASNSSPNCIPGSPRPYRSKRRRPCDRCRHRKLGCRIDHEPPCERCKAARVDCTFVLAVEPRSNKVKRQDLDLGREMLNWDAIAASEGFPDSSLDRYGDFAPKTSAGEDAMEDVLSPQVYHEEDPTTEDKPSNGIHSVDIGGAPDLSPASSINQNSSPQGVGSETYQREDHASTNHSLDEMQDFTAKLFGISAESDPWLLRHCRFDEHGLRRFYKVHFRNVADISEPEQVPVHFMIASNDLVEGFKSDTAPSSSEHDLRTELENLIPTEDGRRLFKLYVNRLLMQFLINFFVY